jgi:hypothetical protein
MRTTSLIVVVVLMAVCQSLLSAEPHPTGLLPPSPQEKAWLDANARPLVVPAKQLAELPARVVNLEHLPPVGRQVVGSCASWSVVYYLKGWQEAKEHGVRRPFPEEHILSPAFVFQWVGTEVGGSSVAANFEFLERHGTTTFAEFPETPWLLNEEPPTVANWKSAASRRSEAGSTSYIPTSTPEGIATVKAVLAGGDLVTAAVDVWANFDNYPANGEGVDREVFFAEGTVGRRDYHAITLIGYDDTKEYHNGTELRRGAFLAVNSWGTGWGVPAVEGGEGGYIWIAYEYYLNNLGAPAVFDFYTMRDRIGYTPRHFVVLDVAHPRRAELSLSLVPGPFDALAT